MTVARGILVTLRVAIFLQRNHIRLGHQYQDLATEKDNERKLGVFLLPGL